MGFFTNTIKFIMPGLKYTLGLFFITILLSIPLGFVLSLIETNGGTQTAVQTKKRKGQRLRRFGEAIPASIVKGYVFIMRGTPLMLQLFFFYFGLPFIPGIGKYLVLPRFTAAWLTFVLNYAAYFCEIFRGGVLAVDKGQNEAAKALGLSKVQTLFYVVIPQMFKIVLPSVANETITLVKDTALATSIGVIDIMHLTSSRVSTTGDITAFAVVAVVYLAMTFSLTKLFNYLEKKFGF